MEEKQLNNAIDACYDAVFDPETWPDALHTLARSLNAVCSMFYPENHSGRFQSVPASRDYAPFLEDYVRNGWYENHYRADRGWPLLKRGKAVIIEHDLASDEERRRLLHYNELYLKWGFPGFAAIGFQLEGEYWCVPFLRAASQGHFEPAESQRMAGLASHFRRMIKLSGDLARDHAATGLAILDTMGSAAILVGTNHSVIAMNRRAERLLNSGLVVRKGRLDTEDQAAKANLYRLIAQAAVTGSASAPPSAPVVIRRPDKRPLIVEAFPARGRLCDLFRSFGALLVVTNLDERRELEADALRRGFGLTPAETRLAIELASGKSVKDAADQLTITSGTARQQLKSIFQKLDVHKQSELAALLSKLPSSR